MVKFNLVFESALKYLYYDMNIRFLKSHSNVLLQSLFILAIYCLEKQTICIESSPHLPLVDPIFEASFTMSTSLEGEYKGSRSSCFFGSIPDLANFKSLYIHK